MHEVEIKVGSKLQSTPEVTKPFVAEYENLPKTEQRFCPTCMSNTWHISYPKSKTPSVVTCQDCGKKSTPSAPKTARSGSYGAGRGWSS